MSSSLLSDASSSVYFHRCSTSRVKPGFRFAVSVHSPTIVLIHPQPENTTKDTKSTKEAEIETLNKFFRLVTLKFIALLSGPSRRGL